MQLRKDVLTAAALAAAVLVAAPSPAAKPRERFTAFAVDMNQARPGARAGTVDIAIDRWSTDAERDQLYSALRENGSDGLLHELSNKAEIGRISTPGRVGLPLRFARERTMPDGSRRVIIGTDRPVGFVETWNSLRSTDYPFLVIELRLGPDGKGDGKLIPAARVSANNDQVLEIENYEAEPVRLTNVHSLG